MSLRPPPFFAATVAAVAVLAGCAATPSDTPTASPTPSATTPVEALAFQPDGTAFDNKQFFDSVLQPVAAESHSQPSHALVNALRAAGFPKKSIQVTPDKTKTGLEADSVFVAVEIDKLCLVAQRTNGKEYISSVESALKIGGCLVGDTQKINW